MGKDGFFHGQGAAKVEKSNLAKLRAGDSYAFREFVQKYEHMVFVCCKSLGLDHAQAQDVAAETFLAASQALPKYAGRAKISTWLLRIAYNKAISFLRKNKRHRSLPPDIESQLADTNSTQASTILENKEMCDIIWAKVQQLPKLWAFAIVMFYREQKSVAEIANIMKKRNNTVRTYLFRGRKRLKEILPDIVGEDFNVSK